MTQPPDRFELEPVEGDFQPKPDNRPRMPEPLPVRLVAVDDVRMLLPAGFDEAALDAFYVTLLGFEKLGPDTLEAQPAYRAENFLLRFEVEAAPVERDTLRPQGVEVLSLAEAEQKLIEAEIEYERHRGVTPGQDGLLARDPGGNWVEIVQVRVVS